MTAIVEWGAGFGEGLVGMWERRVNGWLDEVVVDWFYAPCCVGWVSLKDQDGDEACS